MKKIVLSIFGIFALAACSEDVYHDIDKQNNGLEVGSDPASEDSGGNAPFTHVPGSPPYDSPWEINEAGNPSIITVTPVPYRFENQTGDWGSPYLITLRVTPYVGLAYYDGNNNGDYFGTALNTTDYPNLYAGGNEIGNFIPAFLITLDGSGLPSTGGTVVLEIESSADHCPVLNAMTTTANPLPIHFDLPAGGSPILVTPDEEKLLSEYGKVFFYFCEAIDPVTNMVVWSKYMMPDSSYPTAPPGHWFGTGFSANIPGVGPTVPLLFNNPSSGTPSQELILNIGSVFPPPPPPPLPSFPQYASYYDFPYKGVTIFVKVTTDANKMYVEIDNL